MTPLQLLDALEAFVKQETKDILLPVRVDRKSGENKERAAEVYKMRLPNKTAQTERVPYLLLQYIKSTDTQEQGQDPESECTVRIVAATYSEDESEGAMCVLFQSTRPVWGVTHILRRAPCHEGEARVDAPVHERLLGGVCLQVLDLRPDTRARVGEGRRGEQ